MDELKEKKIDEMEEDDFITNENIKTSKIKSTNLNESTSSYFNKKKSINTCPLCLKTFKTDSMYSFHMKQCAKSHKMTTQQLLGALELQKKQIQERRDFGLSSQITVSKKNTIKKKPETNIESYDLALGLALSKSLTSSEPKAVHSQEAQKTTLEEFGFSLKTTAATNKKKNETDKKFILKNRTSAERQRIIVDKVAVVLLDEDQENDIENKLVKQNSNFNDKQIPQLWNLAETNDRSSWFVQSIKNFILLDEKVEEKMESSPPLENIDCCISELNLPQTGVLESWDKMINNSYKSDLIAHTKDGHSIHLHTLVLFTRCSKILKNNCGNIFKNYNASTILILLKYLYCGTLKGLVRSEINDVCSLAKELDFDELVTVLNSLNDIIVKKDVNKVLSTPETTLKKIQVTDKNFEERECNDINLSPKCRDEENLDDNDILEERDLFTDDINETQKSNESNKSSCENESNVEKSYWSFMQHEKRKKQNVSVDQVNETVKETSVEQEETKADEPIRRFSKDSATKSLDDFNIKLNNEPECVVISSGSDSNSNDNCIKSQEQLSKIPSPVPMDYEIPNFDPYDDFNYFSEEQLSPVGGHSQSLLVGDVSADSIKVSDYLDGNSRSPKDVSQKEQKQPFGYCSTPVNVRRISKENSSVRKKRRYDLSENKILRKSLGLHYKSRNIKSNSAKKKRKISFEKSLVDVFTNSISNLSKVSSPVRSENFIEITPISSKEFKDSVTPSPNFSNMGESMLKEQLTKYGLKKSLAKSKAKKILRHIYDELHPLYNTETGKIVKLISKDSPKTGKKSKSQKVSKKNPKQSQKAVRKVKNQLNTSKDSFDRSNESENGIMYDSSGSEFEDLNKTLTQTDCSNAVDLPSAFTDFLQSNTEYHRKILMYEPVWLEDLQKKLKESSKKHFKISDLCDYLDQKCIAFRSEAQARNLQKRNEKRKGKFSQADCNG